MGIRHISKWVFLLLFTFVITNLSAQDSNHIRWQVSLIEQRSNEITVRFSGLITKGWHLYALSNEEQGVEGVVVMSEDSSIRPGAISMLTKTETIKDPIFEGQSMVVARDSIVFNQKVAISSKPSILNFRVNAQVADAENFIPEEQRISLVTDANTSINPAYSRILLDSIDLQHPVMNCSTSGGISSSAGSAGLFQLFLLGFLGGLLALLTPCVFPMIPLTVSFFTKRSGTRTKAIRNASMYGFFIFLIYVLLSLPFHFLDSLNPEILNNISTNVVLNMAFFIIFVVFAFSFFGFYEITLPASLSSKADSKADTGNILGIFFMALTLALVSFSCTGPILGSLLAGSLSGDGGAMQLTAGMAGFGMALALPFALFALFPNWLHSLPRSGGWLNTVKVVLGFIELGLAMKFLSNAELVMHWGFFKREIFIGIWIVIAGLLTLYLFGILRFSHDGPKGPLSGIRKFLGLISALFTLYLMPGVTNTSYANLSLISGFPPPMYYSIYQQNSECVLGLNCAHSYEEGMEMARQQNKPLLLDFTGYACVNCRRMEENVWSSEKVYALMKDSFIVVSLYVDDKKDLPPTEQFNYVTRDGNTKFIRTVGDKWATFETENFNNNSQPLYAIIDNEERLLTHPVGYSPSVEEYLQWLQCGLSGYNKNK